MDKKSWVEVGFHVDLAVYIRAKLVSAIWFRVDPSSTRLPMGYIPTSIHTNGIILPRFETSLWYRNRSDCGTPGRWWSDLEFRFGVVPGGPCDRTSQVGLGKSFGWRHRFLPVQVDQTPSHILIARESLGSSEATIHNSLIGVTFLCHARHLFTKNAHHCASQRTKFPPGRTCGRICSAIWT